MAFGLLWVFYQGTAKFKAEPMLSFVQLRMYVVYLVDVSRG